jgi:membrane protease YdiL (CAAX protease family)
LPKLCTWIALGTLPVVFTQFPNPVGVWWFHKMKGRAPMPAGLLARARQAGRYSLFAMEALVFCVVLFLSRWQGIRPEQIGLHLLQWRRNLALGCAAGLPWVAIGVVTTYVIPGVRQWLGRNYYQEGNLTFWISIFLLGAFVEEFWRAFCLLTLTKTGYSALVSTALTAVAFAAAHIPKRVGRVVGSGVFGAVAALLYLWTGSLVAPYAAHLTANFSALYWGRCSRPEPRPG